jgi:hypothetical protein
MLCLKAHVAASVSNVLEVCCQCFIWCCKGRSRCCICCNGCTRILQAFVPNVSSIFLDVCCKCVYLDVAYFTHMFASVLSECCVCFAMVSSVFQMSFRCMLQVLYLNISKVDRMLHFLPRVPLPRLGVSSSS